MLSKKNRFHGRGAIRRVFTRGFNRRSRYIMCKIATKTGQSPPRVAVIVSKKIHKPAVQRNRVRRRIFDIVRHELNHIPLGTDIVLTVTSRDVIVMPHQQLSQEILNLISPVSI